MKKWVLMVSAIAGMFISFVANAQELRTFYVASKSGLSIREKPDAKASVISKIPYGTKITINTLKDDVQINTEGITGYWVKTTFGGKTGYVVNSYLFPAPPPKATVKTMPEYMAQISQPFGGKLVVKNGAIYNIEEGGWQLQKQLYKNGAEWHEFRGYEYGSATYFIPDFTISQGFLLLRLIPEFSELWTDKDEFPTTSKTIKKGETEYRITVEKEGEEASAWIKKISITFEEGASYTFEIYQLENQLVVFYGSGV